MTFENASKKVFSRSFNLEETTTNKIFSFKQFRGIPDIIAILNTLYRRRDNILKRLLILLNSPVALYNYSD